jgi:hypothetical protein
MPREKRLQNARRCTSGPATRFPADETDADPSRPQSTAYCYVLSHQLHLSISITEDEHRLVNVAFAEVEANAHPLIRDVVRQD